MSILRIALDVPVDTLFDYSADEASNADIGRRVLVPFGRKRLMGVILEVSASTDVPPARLRRVIQVMHDVPPVPEDILALLRFCGEYYRHPLGEVIMGALPVALRRASTPVRRAGAASRPTSTPAGAGTASSSPESSAPVLNPAQQEAVSTILARPQGFAPWLVHGVTGSGKTEVYLHLIAHILRHGGQALVLAPEIHLTPQLEARFRERFSGARLVVQHSGLSGGARARDWLLAQRGEAQIVLGTRLAVFTPLPRLSLIVVDEEHDPSYKQQEGLRYSARDVAVARAKQAGIPVVLGSATPSLETLYNAKTGRYRLLLLPDRAGPASLPRVTLIDTRIHKPREGLSAPLIEALQERASRGEQSLVFINRRGYAPVLACTACDWVSGCARCASRLVLHLREGRLRCHHCGHEERPPRACPGCGNQDLKPLGHGTQRLESALCAALPGARVLRIDRDSTHRKNAWRGMREDIEAGRVDILVGTQILAKGHDFPGLSLVGIVNPDAALFSSDFRASERLFSQLMQVSGRAGRAETPGTVLIQTRFPGHPLYQALCRHDFDGLAETLLAERRQAGFPPYTFQALLRAEGQKADPVMEFLLRAEGLARKLRHPVTIYGPAPAALPRLAGKERAQLLVETSSRKNLLAFLSAWHPALTALGERRVRWALDVDPMEI